MVEEERANAFGFGRDAQTAQAGRLRVQLAALDTALMIDGLDVPGYRLHPLNGRAKSRWSIWVSGNLRLTLEFRDGMALRLSKAIGRSPQSWLAMQDNYDLWQARKSADLANVRKIPFAVNA
jgi:proteic killer suppression protein